MQTPRQLFMLSPPNAGTTAMLALLMQAPVFWTVTPNGEGQMLPELKSMMREEPWRRERRFDWARIKAAWEAKRPPNRVLLEKSPPNLLRVSEIVAAWPDSVFVVSNRNPYAILASRIGKHPSAPRQELVGVAMQDWLVRSEVQIANMEALRGRSIVTTYERFCAAPQLLLRDLGAWFGDLDIDVQAALRVKHYAPDRISNHNARQISTLSAADISEARKHLARRNDLLSFWDYQLDIDA